MRFRPTHLAALALSLFALQSQGLAQYNRQAAKSAPTESVTRGGVVYDEPVKARDGYGNAAGNQHDLAIDGAFEGQTVAVLHFYTGEGFDFHLPKEALAEKGFSVYRWIGAPPSPEELKKGLDKSCQLWIISGQSQLLNEQHLAVIKEFWMSGKGVYIWGDNDPYYADANFVAEGLFGGKMTGNLMGNQVVNLQTAKDPHIGIMPNHMLTTGLEHLFEGITIATIQPNPVLQPLLYGSAGNLVSAYYDQDGRRAILDGGFTRLYLKWDTAGTARYVKNAASWLVNVEKFGDKVVSEKVKAVKFAEPPPPMPPPPPAPAPVVAESKPVGDANSRLPLGWILVGAAAGFALLYIPRKKKS